MIAVLALVCGTALLFRKSGTTGKNGTAVTKKELLFLPHASNPTKQEQVAEILRSLVSSKPEPGYFYQVQPDDTPMSVALQALGEKATTEDALDYLRSISSGPRWNMPLYSTPSTSKAYPDAFMVPGKRLGVRVAFLPRNQDALSLLLEGKKVSMSVDPISGDPKTPADTSLGLLWFPPVDETFSCAAYSWEDGSSSIDPPPDLLELLE
jgi:hypothetical protein